MGWEIQKRSTACGGCGNVFEEGETYHGTLRREGEAFLRRDLCEDCWARPLGDGSPGFFSQWRGTFRVPETPSPVEPIRGDVVERLLKRYLGSSSPGEARICYVLSLFLERKRRFVERDRVREEGRSWILYEDRRTGDTFLVEDPGMRLDEVPQVQREVEMIIRREEEAARPVEPAVGEG